MSDGITDASRESAKDIERWKRTAIDQLLATFSKEDLVKELYKREGVEIYSPNNYGSQTVLNIGWNYKNAKIIVVKGQ